ncbi:NAD(P)H-binding protein [Nocardioides donggukensis]|uniref:NAD(P)H-binding protein n=1 Tax=Nocardioides donggukensis TaxID=2774019 RepID=A0A927K599_9ACTN|nr:NAD(P)H-binding protein [Nocardioides donggukensis]MBD8868121.1 NAD(P)H-binding protein [Nocardioides donggukensis]
MRIVVTGARGYIGSRLVPVLLERGHDVVATATSDPSGSPHPWADRVTWVRMDLLEPAQVRDAVRGADAVCYLVHALDRPGFADLDRRAATAMREAVDAAGVPRLVYLSGLVPDRRGDGLSAHLASRLEVEEILLAASASTTSLRAGVVLGAGSTSFEIIRQMASALLVQPVPSWLTTRIQPIGVGDVVALLAHALEHRDDPVGARDVGGPDVVRYPDLLAAVAREARLLRIQLPTPPVPVSLVSLAAPLFSAAPPRTVASLVASLRHDMVCDPARTWTLPGVSTPLRTALRASLRDDGDPALAAYRSAPGDPVWTGERLLGERLTGLRLPMPAVARSVALTAEQRARDVIGLLRGRGD